jgi:hypothetical protein
MAKRVEGKRRQNFVSPKMHGYAREYGDALRMKIGKHQNDLTDMMRTMMSKCENG